MSGFVNLVIFDFSNDLYDRSADFITTVIKYDQLC